MFTNILLIPLWQARPFSSTLGDAGSPEIDRERGGEPSVKLGAVKKRGKCERTIILFY